MEYQLKSGSPDKQRSACLVVGVFEPRRLSAAAEAVDRAAGGLLSTILRRGDMDGRRGQLLLLHQVPGVLADRVLLVGLGRERELTDGRYREVVRAAVAHLDEGGAMEATVCLCELPVKGRDLYWRVRETVVAAEDALYRFETLKSEKTPRRRPLRRLTLMVPGRRERAVGEEAVRHGEAIAEGVRLARDLGNLPGNICTPAHLADEARRLAEAHEAVSVEVLEREDMERLGMGALLSVAKGSRQPPKLIVLHYRGAAEDERPYALVGKGITFDSGGISIKPAAAMDEMKFDMCGAAAVLGTFRAAARLGLPVNLVGLIPSCENLPDGAANKPGDVVTSLSGKTIEVLNTDAEGRLILCDALTYAGRYEPRAVVDIATLTGACVIALGRHAHGLFANQPGLAHELLEAGRRAGDRAWELPLWDEYQEQLKSNFADMANVGGRDAGAITAACFLARFAEKYRWAHLDIAGTAWLTGEQKGATGRPVPLLVQWLLDRAAGA
ncbi:leucyl aminopeptidase [Inmirania thermothiophila]|uniref:Probable cytosol aminopeptidase n=1 Tax=Inmirania thermothiophila TaxID=1750597 RepID=A0A3N1Y2X9_9GAMM|nr:leucyl aminopeptidase [Inmirania thermothiophila]ROR32891.1 aminopeptidase A [Inmirania thermothiophila]